MTEKFLPSIESSNTHIAPIAAEDISLLADIRREVDGEKNTQPERFAQELARYRDGGDHRAFLMREGDGVIGYVEVDRTEDHVPKGADPEACRKLQSYGHIARVGLLASHRGRGLGNRLLETAEAWARERGALGMWLDYLPEKEPLVTFYEAAGYMTYADFKDGDTTRTRRIAVKKF